MKDRFIYRVLVNALALYIVAQYLVDNFVIDNVVTALMAGLVLGIVNALIKPVFVILSLPFNILSLGLFTLIINGVMLKLTAALVAGMRINGFWSSVWSAILISLVSVGINWILIKDK